MTIEHIRNGRLYVQGPHPSALERRPLEFIDSKNGHSVEAEKLSRRLWRYLMGLPENKDALTKDWRAMVEPLNPDTRIQLPTPFLAD